MKLHLDAAIIRAVKKEALKTGRMMAEVIEDSLRETLLRKKETSKKRFDWRW